MNAKANYKEANSMFRALKPHIGFINALTFVRDVYGKEVERAVWNVFIHGHERYDFDAWTNSGRYLVFLDLVNKALWKDVNG